MTLTSTHHGGGARGGPRSVEALSRDHGLELLRFAYLVSGDRARAEDLLQDVLLALYRRFGDQLPVDNPVAYTRRAIVNTNISWARRSSSSELAVDELPERAAHADPDPADRDALWQAMKRLPVRQRTVLVLRYYADAADTDIADLLGCRRGTVRSLASRALDALRDDPTLDHATEGGAR